jgi:hypothetical protein
MKDLTKEQEKQLEFKVNRLYETCYGIQDIIAKQINEFAGYGMDAGEMADYIKAYAYLLETCQEEYNEAQKGLDLRT